eukprot:138709_1
MVESSDNINDHSGFKPSELFIEKKYCDFKDELMNNSIHPISLYKYNISLTKAKEYIISHKAKTLFAVNIVDHNGHKVLHYGIKNGSPLTVLNLFAIILYCDESDLSTAFSGTFRRNDPFENLESVKNRNREFWNWSKLIRETVQYYGTLGYDIHRANDWNKKRDRERGPFFCGLSSEMVFPEFYIRLCAPTSTSKQIAIATRFAGERGTLIELNTTGYEWSYLLRFFDCSWISNYTEEDERLFCGGDYRIQLVTVRMIHGAKNYKLFLISFGILHSMINGLDIQGYEPQMLYNQNQLNKFHKILSTLINNDENKYDGYVNETFKLFKYSQNKIIINIHFLYRHFQYACRQMTDLIVDKKTRLIREQIF